MECKKEEHLPIIDGQCCVNLTMPMISGGVHRQSDGNPTPQSGYDGNSSPPDNRAKRCRFIRFSEALTAILILCFAGLMVYLTVASGFLYRSEQVEETDRFVVSESVTEEPATESNEQDWYQYFYEHQLPNMSPELREILLQIDRQKRDADTSPCKLSKEHCKAVIESMWSIVSVVNNSMPHLQAFLKNFTTDTSSPKSKFVELVECLQCKKNPAPLVNESGHENVVNDNRTLYNHFDRAHIKNNVEVVTDLLNNDKQDDQKRNSSGDSIVPLDSMVEQSTTLISGDTSKQSFEGTTEVPQVRNSTTKLTEHESISTEMEGFDLSKSSTTTIGTMTTGATTTGAMTAGAMTMGATKMGAMTMDATTMGATKMGAMTMDTTTMGATTTGATTTDATTTGATTTGTTTVDVTTTNATMTSASTTSASLASKAEEATNSINNTRQTTIVGKMTTKPDRDNATEVTNGTVHPSMHPSNQGQGEWNDSEREASKISRKSSNVPDLKERIIFNDQLQNKGNMDLAPSMIPTAETMKSTQQLQLTPTMSWMPYQVCFYGPAANGPTKHSAPGQTMYPVSSPGASYPASMAQQRPGPNFFQVQAQSVQFLPMPPQYPGYSGPFGGQRPGPTGPGMQSYPIFPGHQTSATGGFNPSGKSSYYCTYIPAPTFQFPAIPGVSEYQRSSLASGQKNNVTDTKEATDSQRSLLAGYAEPCPYNMIRCGNGKRCILRSQWCDGQVDCTDASDEATCSCRDRISQERLCDGYFDCPHGEDELGCLGCPKTSFSCNDWQRRYTVNNCVPLSQRCDGIEQCVNGKDEADCAILTENHIEGKDVFTIGYTEGYLHKNFKGEWYPVCTTADTWARDACASEIGSESNGTPTTKIRLIPDNVYKGPYLAEVNGQAKLIPSCMNTAVYVQCPRFPCGTRVSSSQDSVRPSALDRDEYDTLQPITEKLRPLFENEVDWRGNENDKNNSTDEDMVGAQLRVVGGRASQPNAWPFLVAIYKDGRFHCGGIILNELWILTAAHCVDGYMGHYYEIQAGMLRRFSFSPMSQFKRARYAIMHPRYNSKEMTNDIGMIMLDNPLRFNRWVRPVCLPEKDILGSMWRRNPEPDSTCLAIGWGATSERGPDPDHLREVEVPILKSCKYEVDRNEAAICAGYPQGGRDACQGDSGGPLMCRNPYSESQWYVAGIVSHGEGCGRPNEPGAYTKVSYFLDWIQEISNGREIPPLKRTPLTKCPGFSCEGGLGKCLPIEARCNRIIDCLDGEDELNCHEYWNRPFYRYLNNPDPDPDPGSETVSPAKDDTIRSTMSQQNGSIDASGIEAFNVTDQTFTTGMQFNETDPDNIEKLTTIDPISIQTTSAPIELSTAMPTIFVCTRLLQTISIDKKCNREVDCEDGTDETNCTCKDYLLNVKPTAICDGYLDCDDKSDEQDCGICSEDQFFCKHSGICIAASKKCDGRFDCKFKEDESDCFALIDGQNVYLDADERPMLNMQGILARNIRGQWQMTCHNSRVHKNQSTLTLIGQNMCEYFGFAGLQSSLSITVKNSKLGTIDWNQNNVMQQGMPPTVSLNDKDKTCSGLYIRCLPVLSDSINTYLTIDTSTGNHVYLWPWLSAIFIDGEYRCTALLLDHNWLLSASKCVENIRLDQNYTMAVFGYGPWFRHVNGPHQQLSIIDEIQPVNNSASVLLHVKHHVNFTRHVQPLFLDKTIYLPGANDSCVAVGTNEKHETESIFLNTVLQNCQSCHRCFVNTFAFECPENQPSDWSGIVFCRGRKSWYPAATFQDHKGPCSFREPQMLTGIDHINPYLTEAMDGKRQSMEASCDGFRCGLGQCISKDRLCDGVPDCRDQADENPQYCEDIRENCQNNVDGCNCKRSELRCRSGACVDKSAYCNGITDCVDGSDEPIICTCAEYLKLTRPSSVCDGVRHCFDKTDESPEACPCTENSLKCRTSSGNDTCVPRDFICDGDKDCADGEDEATCMKLKQSANYSNTSGEVMRRSYGVWHTECFPNPVSPTEASNLCAAMEYVSGDISNETVITDAPMVPKRDEFFMVKINDWAWTSLRHDKPFVTLVEANDTCHRAFVDCI